MTMFLRSLHRLEGDAVPATARKCEARHSFDDLVRRIPVVDCSANGINLPRVRIVRTKLEAERSNRLTAVDRRDEVRRSAADRTPSHSGVEDGIEVVAVSDITS